LPLSRIPLNNQQIPSIVTRAGDIRDGILSLKRTHSHGKNPGAVARHLRSDIFKYLGTSTDSLRGLETCLEARLGKSRRLKNEEVAENLVESLARNTQILKDDLRLFFDHCLDSARETPEFHERVRDLVKRYVLDSISPEQRVKADQSLAYERDRAVKLKDHMQSLLAQRLNQSDDLKRTLYELVDWDRKPLPYRNGNNPSNPPVQDRKNVEPIGLYDEL